MIAGGIVAGALFLLSMALFIGVTAPQMPPMSASAAEKAAFYAEQARSPIYSLVRMLIFVQLAPIALFLGGLSARLRRAEGGDGSLSSAIFAAGLLGAFIAPMAELVEGHLLLGLAVAGADPVVTVGFDGMTPVAFGLSGILQLIVLVGSGLLLLLGTQPDLEVAGEAATGDEAVRLAAELRPDVILMDIKMPGISGIEATRRILAADPRVRVLVVTMFEDDATVFTALRAGARDFVLKDAEHADILRAIRSVGRGEAIFSPSIAGRLIDFFGGGRPAVPREVFPGLTTRERELLQLMADGASNTEIAGLLDLSAKTVANYVSSILGKLQAADRAEAVRMAREAGLGGREP